MRSNRFLPALLLLFVASGCAALIYEVVWFQLLQLVIGSSSISLAVLLGTYMGGLCLGSFAFPRFISAQRHPLRVYALLEVGIGVIAIAVLFGMPLVSGVYTAWAGHGVRGLLLRALAAGICLLPPTVLMGATLPALSRSVEEKPGSVSWLGFLYAGNIGGAVFGTLLAGFYLLRLYDISTATYIAVAINFIVAAIAVGISTLMAPPAAAPAGVAGPLPAQGNTGLHLAIGISGFTALAAEVIWTRYLSLLFGTTTYTFSLILAGFLLGLGIGSGLGAALSSRLRRPRLAFGWCQALLCVTVAWAAIMLTDSMPYWPVVPELSRSPWFTFQLDFLRCLWVVLPAAILWGASFPLALAAAVRPGQDPAELVGKLYGANTIGAIAGSLIGGLAFVVIFGSQRAQQVLLMLSAISALIVLRPQAGEAGTGRRPERNYALSLIVIQVSAALLAVFAVHKIPGMLVAMGRYTSTTPDNQFTDIYVGEGLTATLAVSRRENGFLGYSNGGKTQASNDPADMRLQRMLGAMTTLVPASPKSVLVIACGAGITAGQVSIDPRVEKLTIAEIEPLVPAAVAHLFATENFDVVRNPKTTVRVDDGRHFILTSREKFDAITSDPLDPWMKGAAMLYTKEFFEMARQHLNPGGVMTLFVQLYWSNEEAVKSQLATFFEAFPDGVAFGNTRDGGGYDLVLLGQVDPAPINVDDIERRLETPEYAIVAKSLRETGFASAVELFGTYAGQARDLGPWLSDAAINRDSDLRLQYLAGMGLNQRIEKKIYKNILIYRERPDALFATTSDETRARIFETMEKPGP